MKAFFCNRSLWTIMGVLISLSAQAASDNCSHDSTPIDFLTCLDQHDLFPLHGDGANTRMEKAELVQSHPQLASAHCGPAAMVSVQAFRDCLGDHLGSLQASSEESTINEDQVALVQCFGLTNPQQFRDCAFGHFSSMIRL